MTRGSRLSELGALIDDLASGYLEPRTVAPNVRVFRSTHPTAPLNAIASPNVALVAQGAKRSLVGDRVFDYSAGQFLAVAVDLPLTSQVSKASEEMPFLAVGMSLDPALIAELLLDLPPRTARPAGPAIGDSQASPELIDALLRFLLVVRSPPDHRVLGPAIMREIHWRLLTGTQGEMIQGLGRAGGELSTVARAGAWLRENLDRPYRVEELAAAVGLSISSVNRSFRRTTRLSPLPYQNPTTWSENRFRDGTVPHPSQPARQQSLSRRFPQS